jgi:uncharacterized membrane protein (UPF0127 family)
MVEITLQNGEKMEAYMANTHMKRIKGLSGVKEKKSLLFTFPLAARWSFWMPFMHYPLSIVYLNKDKEVVEVLSAVPMTKNPNTWKIYKPKKACKYVLETPEEHNIKIGDILKWN